MMVHAALVAAVLFGGPQPEPNFSHRSIDLLKNGPGVLASSKAVFDEKRRCYYLVGGVWDGQVVRLDPSSGELTEIFRTQKGLTDIVYAPTVDRIFVSSSYKDLFVLDPARKYRVAQRWKGGGRPHVLAFDAGSKRLYVGNSSYSGRDAPGRSVQVFTLGRRSPLATIETPMAAELMALDPKAQRLYVSAPRSPARNAGPERALVAIDTTSLKLVDTREVALASNVLVLDSAARKLLLSKGTSRTLQSVPLADLNGESETPLAPSSQLVETIPEGYYIADGYFEPRDGTVRLLLCIDRHRVLLDPERTDLPPYVVTRWKHDGQSYQLTGEVELPDASEWRGTLSPGPTAEDFVAVARESNLALLGRFDSKDVTRHRVGFEADRLVANSTTHRAYIAAHETGQIAIVDTKAGRVLDRQTRPPDIEWLGVDEARDRVFVLCLRSMHEHDGWDNRWILYVTDGAMKQTLLTVPLRLAWIGLARLRDHHLDPRGMTLRLIFTTGIIEVDLETGATRTLSRPVRDDIVGYRIDLGQERMLVGGSRRQLALIDTRALEVVESTELDHRKECAPAVATNRRLGPFDVCAAAVQMWRPGDIGFRFRDMVPFRVTYRLMPHTDRGPSQPGSTVRLAGLTGDGETIALHELDLTTMTSKRRQFLTLVAQGRQKPDFYDDQTLFALDRRNGIVIQLHRGAFKERTRPSDFRKELNRVYSFRLDDKESVLRLYPRAALRDNPRDIALDVDTRTAVVTHGHSSSLTLLQY